MKNLFIIFFLLYISQAHSQELKISIHTGYSIGEMEHLKKNMLLTGIIISNEFFLKHDLVFNIGLGGSVLRFDYIDTLNGQVFNTKRFFNLPISVKKYYPISRKSNGFVEFGFMNSLLYRDKQEIKIRNKDKKKFIHGLGYNLGALFSVGFKTRITERVSFDVGFSGYTDFIYKHKDESNKIKNDSRTLTISFYRKFIK